MIYLKTYKLFEEIENDTEQTLKEICFDLTDNDEFEITFETIESDPSCYYSSENKSMVYRNLEFDKYILIDTAVRGQGFRLVDIKDTILRIKEFLGNKFGYLEAYLPHNASQGTKIEFNENYFKVKENLIRTSTVYGIIIFYK